MYLSFAIYKRIVMLWRSIFPILSWMEYFPLYQIIYVFMCIILYCICIYVCAMHYYFETLMSYSVIFILVCVCSSSTLLYVFYICTWNIFAINISVYTHQRDGEREWVSEWNMTNNHSGKTNNNYNLRFYLFSLSDSLRCHIQIEI